PRVMIKEVDHQRRKNAELLKWSMRKWFNTIQKTELKDRLLCKYSGNLSSLRQEFFKKKKKGNLQYIRPYPS
ncbi:hypothetical protein KI387_009118, partial [Taxus chinensis]